MYSIVLAAMLSTAPATPQWGGCHGCHGCHGCWSCHGCHGCSGCYGCSGCWGCGGGYGGAGYGYGGYSYPGAYGCYGAFGCAGGGYACVGCYGCYGWGGYAASAPVLPAVAEPRMPGASGLKAAPATVVVQLPADSKLIVEGQVVTLDAGSNSFTTPTLEPGASYVYTVQSQSIRNGRPVTESKDVEVRAGQTARVTFATAGTAPAVVRNRESAPARITVQLPEDAKLYVNGVLCPLTTERRAFDTPRLDADRDYTYDLTAEVVREGKTQKETKKVVFRAGQPVKVDFGAMTDVRTAAR